MIFSRCQKCQEIKSNIALLEDPHQPDDYALILQLPGKTP